MTDTHGGPKSNGTGERDSPDGALDATADQIQLPRYVTRQADGMYVSLQIFDSASHFTSFIDRIFGSGIRFAELNYDNLCNLLYNWDIPEIYRRGRDLEAAGKPTTLRLAAGILPFPPERQKLYRNIKLIEGGDAAQYRFEPILAEPDGSDDDGQRVIALDVDEFIAVMWCKNVRFGIDIALVQDAFANQLDQAAVVARMRGATEGKDATVEELINTLHRSNAPKVLADGRVDLHQFQNRFPQMEKNTRLVKKVPRVAGKSGWSLSGKEIAPLLPKDFDIATLAGPGTRIERSNLGEFLIADIAGFLQIDASSQLFSIADKIVNMEGVSQRTTGNLVLLADEYEEHGVVEEHASVEAKHMAMHADVFGALISHGGRVLLKANLVGGAVTSPGGFITIEGNASRSSIEAIGGSIVIHYAESCRIVAAKVHIEKAVHCDILAQELFIDSAEGCALAAPKMEIDVSTDRHEVDTIISILVPDMAELVNQLNELTRQQGDCEAFIARKRAELEALSGQPDIKTYQLLNAKLRANELKMTLEQESNWQKLLGRVTPILKQLKAVSDTLRDANGLNENLKKKLADIQRETADASLDISCSVANVQGETMIRTLTVNPEAPSLETLTARELHARLRKSGADSTILFNDSEGEFAWTWTPEDEGDAGK